MKITLTLSEQTEYKITKNVLKDWLDYLEQEEGATVLVQGFVGNALQKDIKAVKRVLRLFKQAKTND